MEKQTVELLKKVKEKQEISDKVYNELYPTCILNGLCKIHKSIVDGVSPFRPILFAIGTPTYKLAIFLCHY